MAAASDLWSEILPRIDAWEADHAPFIAGGKAAAESMQEGPVRAITLVCPMYGEHERYRPKTYHKFGQDFIRFKVEQLKLVEKWSKGKLRFHILFMDDGCGNKSGEVVQYTINMMGYQDYCDVDWLQAHIDAGDLPSIAGLETTKGSIKGGAQRAGMYKATTEAYQAWAPAGAQHYICLTDCDLCFDMKIVPLLLEPFTKIDGLAACKGERYSEGSRIWLDDQNPIPATSAPESWDKAKYARLGLRRSFHLSMFSDLAKNVADIAGVALILRADVAKAASLEASTFSPSVELECMLVASKMGSCVGVDVSYRDLPGATQFSIDSSKDIADRYAGVFANYATIAAAHGVGEVTPETEALINKPEAVLARLELLINSPDGPVGGHDLRSGDEWVARTKSA